MSRDADGPLAGIADREGLAALRDALAASEARFRNIIEKNADGVIVIGRDGRIAYVNPAAEALLQRSAGELLGTHFGIPLVPGDTTELDLPGIGQGRGMRVAEMRVVETEWEGCPAALATLRDVTERKRSEEALRTAEERFRMISQVTSDFSYSFRVLPDRKLLLEWLTEAFTRVTGYAASEVRRLGWEALVFPQDRLAVEAHFARVMQGESDVCEARILTQAGTVRWLRHAARPVRQTPGGPVTRIFGAGQDITERRRLEDELRHRVQELAEADRRKDEFLAMLAHELRNPLSPIRNAVEILRHIREEQTQVRMRELIHGQVQLLSRLLDDLLDVSRITTGKIVLRKERVDLNAVARRAMELMQGVVAERKLEIQIQLTVEPLPVDADPVRLQQVVSNLLHNATKYTDPGGTIRIETARRAEEGILRVRDTGIGIEPEMLARIFDLFAQVDRSLDRTRGGLGIGLTLARQLIQLHGGRLDASSPGLGQGSAFSVVLPLAFAAGTPGVPAAAPAPTPPDGPPESAGRRVLIVDDNVDSARSLALLLRLWGHEPTVVHDGPEAIEAATRERPEVVLLDIGLPRLDGYEVAYRLRRQPELDHTMLIAMTGYGQDEDRRRSQSAGFDAHLVKPVDLPTLERMLANPQRDRGGDSSKPA